MLRQAGGLLGQGFYWLTAAGFTDAGFKRCIKPKREMNTPKMINEAPRMLRHVRLSPNTAHANSAAVTGSSAYKSAVCVVATLPCAHVCTSAATKGPQPTPCSQSAIKSQSKARSDALRATDKRSNGAGKAPPAQLAQNKMRGDRQERDNNDLHSSERALTGVPRQPFRQHPAQRAYRMIFTRPTGIPA